MTRPLTDDDPRHGKRYVYVHYGCRCQKCREANSAGCRVAADKREETPFHLIPHGQNGYTNYGCRCTECRTAQKANMARRTPEQVARYKANAQAKRDALRGAA